MVSGGELADTAPPVRTIGATSATVCRRVQALVAAADHGDGRRARPTAAACAAPSMPSARPDTIVAPSSATASAIRPAVARPTSVGRRVPTTATARVAVERRGVAAHEQDRRRQLDPPESRRVRRRRPASGPRRPARRTGSRQRLRVVRRLDERRAPPSGRASGGRRRRPSRRRGRRVASVAPRLREDGRRAPERADEPSERHGADALDAASTTQASRSASSAGRGGPRPARAPAVGRRRVRAAWSEPPDAEHQPASRERGRSAGSRNRAASSRCAVVTARCPRGRRSSARPAAGAPCPDRTGPRARRARSPG